MTQIYRYFDTQKKGVISVVHEIVESDRFVRLNAEQLAFFNTHRRASYDEIWNAQEYVAPTPEPYVPVEPTLEECKAEALKELSKLSLEILGSHIGEYQLVNAMLSLRADEYDKIYDDDKSEDLIDVYLTVGKMCREKYYEAKSAVEACETKEQVKGVKDEYTDDYEKLRKK